MENNIREWYMSAFPTDELGCELYNDVTFADLYNDIGNVYDVIGVGDSIIRERLFAKLAEVLGVDYSHVYKKWLNSY